MRDGPCVGQQVLRGHLAPNHVDRQCLRLLLIGRGLLGIGLRESLLRLRDLAVQLRRLLDQSQGVIEAQSQQIRLAEPFPEPGPLIARGFLLDP
jgi:hypothetical protein